MKLTFFILTTLSFIPFAYSDSLTTNFSKGLCNKELRENIVYRVAFACIGTQNNPVIDEEKYTVFITDGIKEYQTNSLSMTSKNGFGSVIFSAQCINKPDRIVGFAFYKYIENIKEYAPQSNEWVDGNCVFSAGGTMFQTEEI